MRVGDSHAASPLLPESFGCLLGSDGLDPLVADAECRGGDGVVPAPAHLLLRGHHLPDLAVGQQLESEYAHFAENIGGEIARHALQGADGKYLQKLSLRGTPLSIKFSYLFSCLDSQNQERAASSFVKVEIARLLRGASERVPVELDGWVMGDVPPEHIREIQVLKTFLLEVIPSRKSGSETEDRYRIEIVYWVFSIRHR